MSTHDCHRPDVPAVTITTARLRLVLESTGQVLARIEAWPAADRAEVSPEWIAQLQASAPTPWTHGFAIFEEATGTIVGSCGYKGPPASDGSVEIAYGIVADYRGRGYAREAAAALTAYAYDAGHVSVVRAHTRPENEASARVVAACGFHRVGEVEDPEDGLVCRWEHRRG
jgi:[ribosomal protein S5]-alanine N-acetyltransferase